jgi:hypothetical protein
VLFDRSIVFLAASGAFQLNNIQGIGHHRESLAQPFLATPRRTPSIHRGQSCAPCKIRTMWRAQPLAFEQKLRDVRCDLRVENGKNS